MRNLMLVLIGLPLIGCGGSEPDKSLLVERDPIVVNEEIDESAWKTGEPDKTSGLEGIYCTPLEISGFSGTVLELKAGRFRYWFYSDVIISNGPKYPLSGEYSIEEGRLMLHHQQVSQSEWYVEQHKEIPLLMRTDALKSWREQKKFYDYGVLIKTAGELDERGIIPRPSIRVLYDADRQWKDPYVHGPQ